MAEKHGVALAVKCVPADVIKLVIMRHETVRLAQVSEEMSKYTMCTMCAASQVEQRTA